jgi:DNA repair protein RadC
MAVAKITDFLAADALTGAELLEIVQAGGNKKLTVADLALKVLAMGQYSQLVGDGTNVNIEITHGLNTRDLHVTVRRATAPYDQVMADNEATSLNTVTLKFGAIAPGVDAFRVTVSK